HGPDLHAADRPSGNHNADRPASASHGVAGGPAREAGGGTNHNFADRPVGAGHNVGTPNHTFAGSAEHNAQVRVDRPPGATGSGSAGIRGGSGGPAHVPSHEAVAHNDRPPGAMSGGNAPHGSAEPRQFAQPHPAVQPHVNQGDQMRGERSAPRMEAPREAPHM